MENKSIVINTLIRSGGTVLSWAIYKCYGGTCLTQPIESLGFTPENIRMEALKITYGSTDSDTHVQNLRSVAAREITNENIECANKLIEYMNQVYSLSDPGVSVSKITGLSNICNMFYKENRKIITIIRRLRYYCQSILSNRIMEDGKRIQNILNHFPSINEHLSSRPPDLQNVLIQMSTLKLDPVIETSLRLWIINAYYMFMAKKKFDIPIFVTECMENNMELLETIRNHMGYEITSSLDIEIASPSGWFEYGSIDKWWKPKDQRDLSTPLSNQDILDIKSIMIDMDSFPFIDMSDLI